MEPLMPAAEQDLGNLRICFNLLHQLLQSAQPSVIKEVLKRLTEQFLPLAFSQNWRGLDRQRALF